MTQPKTAAVIFGDSEYSTACRDGLHERLDVIDIDLHGDLPAQLKGCEMVVDVGGGGFKELIDAAADVKFWQVIGTGVDHCDVPYLHEKKIPIANTPGFASARGLAECAMMFILMLSRKYGQSRENFFARKFWQPSGHTLDGQTLAIVGFGASGRWLARHAKFFGMRIEAIDVRPLDDDIPEEQRPDFYGMSEDLDDVIARCDFLSVHLHLTDETRHIIDARRLALMKPTAYVINVARGALIDQDALGEAVIKGKIAGAGIDTFAPEPADADRPEYQLKNFLVTPHIAGQTDDTVRRRCDVVAENARRLAAGEEPLYVIDPSAGLGRK